MRRASLLTAATGLVGSLLLSIAAYVLFDTILLFLFVPLVPILFRSTDERPPQRVCPECGSQARSAEYEYCPRDGTRLREAESAS